MRIHARFSVGTILAVVAALLLLWSCSSTTATSDSVITGRRTIAVTVTMANIGTDRSPRRPILVQIRTRSGKIVARAETDNEGFVRISFESSSDDPAVHIEALADDRYSASPTGSYEGTIVSLHPEIVSYCINLPPSCVY